MRQFILFVTLTERVAQRGNPAAGYRRSLKRFWHIYKRHAGHGVLCMTATAVLSNGVELPRVGVGTFKSKGASVTAAVTWALCEGIEHIDTASIYKVRPSLKGCVATGMQVTHWFRERSSCRMKKTYKKRWQRTQSRCSSPARFHPMRYAGTQRSCK